MKRVVLYAKDLEPITVIELNDFAWKLLSDTSRVRIDVITAPSRLGAKIQDNCYIVNIEAERLVRRGSESLMLFTADEEAALMMKSAFLPGQRSVLQELEWNAFAYGFKAAMKRLGGEC